MTVSTGTRVSRKHELSLKDTNCENELDERFNVQSEVSKLQHPLLSRRTTIQAGALGLLGLGMNHVQQLQAAMRAESTVAAKRVVYVFLTGGLSQQDSFDMKPLAPDNVRGEFQPISTKTPGLQICEHLPQLAQSSDKWTLVRSLSHWSNEHNESHTIMLTGRSQLPPGYNENKPQPSDWPAIAGRLTQRRGNLPPAIVLPQRLLKMNQGGVVILGQFGGTIRGFSKRRHTTATTSRARIPTTPSVAAMKGASLIGLSLRPPIFRCRRD